MLVLLVVAICRDGPVAQYVFGGKEEDYISRSIPIWARYIYGIWTHCRGVANHTDMMPTGNPWAQSGELFPVLLESKIPGVGVLSI